MSFISKMRKAISSKANSALDRAIDPEKEIDVLIAELEAQRKEAIAELVSYKATANKMEHDLTEQREKAEQWEKRAMLAVKKGDDETAKDCLRRKKECQVEIVKIKRDQAEAAGYASQLNQSRKQVDLRLKMLKLKKGTMATQLAAARGKGDVFSSSNELFDKLERAEQQIEEEAIEVEVAAELEGPQREAELESQLLKAASQPAQVVADDDPLAQLKAKMESDKKLLNE
jgi:phage shock protein A